MTPIDHESVSDQLVPYVRGELHAATVSEIEEHLESCADCRLELSAVRALVSDDVPAMTDLERAKLHRGVREQVEIAPLTTRAMAWVGPALSVAAFLLVVVVGIQFLGGMSGNDEDAGAGGESAADSGGDFDGPTPVTVRLTGTDVTTFATSEASVPEPAPGEEPVQPGDSAGMGARPPNAKKKDGPRADLALPADDLVRRRLSRYASTGKTFVSFASAYSAEDAESLRDEFTATLLQDAPPGARDQLVECADFVAEARPSPTLPVVAGHGNFAGKRALMLGFVWTDEPTGPLDQFMIFVWGRGNCDNILHYQSGQIKT